MGDGIVPQVAVLEMVLKWIKEGRLVNSFNVIKLFLFLGKLLGFTIFTVTGDDVDTMDFQFKVLDILIYIVYLSGHLFLIYYRLLLEDKKDSYIATFGTDLVLIMSVLTGIISSTLVIGFRRKLLRIVQLFHQIDVQVDVPVTRTEGRAIIPFSISDVLPGNSI